MLIHILNQNDTNERDELRQLLDEVSKGQPRKQIPVSQTNEYSEAINLCIESVISLSDAIKTCDIRIG